MNESATTAKRRRMSRQSLASVAGAIFVGMLGGVIVVASMTYQSDWMLLSIGVAVIAASLISLGSSTVRLIRRDRD